MYPQLRRLYSLLFFNDPATTAIYTLSLHDALPISSKSRASPPSARANRDRGAIAATAHASSIDRTAVAVRDRKSTRLNSSHSSISYAVFCLKKKKKKYTNHHSYQYISCYIYCSTCT